MNPLIRIRANNKSKPLTGSDLVKIYDLFMKEYGWIPLEEFKNMPLSLFWRLYEVILERKKKEKEEYDKLKRKNKRLK